MVDDTYFLLLVQLVLVESDFMVSATFAVSLNGIVVKQVAVDIFDFALTDCHKAGNMI